MEKPTLSPDFTIEDIHKIRVYNYEMTKDMSFEDRVEYYNQGSRAFNELLEERKKQLLQQAV